MSAARYDVGGGVVGWLRDVSVGDVRCWLLVTDGLRASQHPELAVPVRAHPQLDREATARSLVELVRAIAGVAARGQRVSAGDTTRLGGSLLGFDGLFYLPAIPIGDHYLPNTHLIGLFASADELALVEEFGARRLASLLARQTRHYPYPPWTDPGRERFAIATSVLANMPRVRLPGATVTREGGALQLRLGRARTAPVLRSVLAQLPPETPPTFILAGVDPGADACLVWSPNQQAPEAVAPPGSRGERVGGCFIATANQQDANGSQIVEDGFAYFFRDADYARVRTAWESGQDVRVRGAQPGDDFIVTWVDDDGAPAQPASRRVRIIGVELANEPSGEGDAARMAEYIRALAAVAEASFPAGDSFEARLQVRIDRGEAKIDIATRPTSPPQDVMQRAYDALHAVPAPHTSEPLGFAIHLAID